MAESITKTLREKTQSFRDKARRILRMKIINNILQEIFIVNKILSALEKTGKYLTEQETSAEKIVARAEYKMSNLDPEDPDFDEKKAKAIKFIETEKTRQESTIENLNTEIKRVIKEIESNKKDITDLNKDIEAVESGETKISIEKMNELTETLILDS